MDRDEEVQLVHSTLIEFWKLYMTWFNWYFGINITVFAVIFLKIISGPRIQIQLIAMGVFCADVIALGAPIAMIMYTRAVRTRIATLNQEPISDEALGGLLTRYAGYATLATNLLLALAWLYIWCANPEFASPGTSPILD
jgi:hypothetical protein